MSDLKLVMTFVGLIGIYDVSKVNKYAIQYIPPTPPHTKKNKGGRGKAQNKTTITIHTRLTHLFPLVIH